jgi:hypothetical protein
MVKSNWRTVLMRELTAQERLYGPIEMSRARFLDVELILALYFLFLPNQDPAGAWCLLNGTGFPAIEAQSLEARRAIARTRVLLRESLGRWNWERLLRQYRAVHDPYPLFATDGNVELRLSPILPDRLEHFRQAMSWSVETSQRKPRYVSASGRYRFRIDREVVEIEIPSRVVDLPDTYRVHPLESNARPISLRESLHITLAELQATAAWMDANTLPGSKLAQNWARRLMEVELALVDSTGISPGDGLTLNGLVHLIGMVGSGKSTLLTVMAIHLARQGRRVVMVMGDVASLLRLEAVFETFRTADPLVSSVPLVGRSTRVNHLNRLHNAEAQLERSLLRDHPAYPMLSTICPLDGLRQDVRPIPLGAEPCVRLSPVESDSESGISESNYDCPFLPVCPIHRPSRELAAARIWLATPASLITSGPQPPLVSNEGRYVELVMRFADVVLVDEADAVQVQFDSYFAPFEVLIGPNESWLDRLAQQVARQMYRPARPRVGRNPALDRWRTVHNNVQQAADSLYYWLRESASTQEWLGETYFSGERLLQRVETEIESEGGDTAVFSDARAAFGRSAAGMAQARLSEEPVPAAWLDAVQRQLFSADPEAALHQLSEWLRRDAGLSTGTETREVLAHHLLIALIVGIMDHALQDMIAGWAAAEEELELDQGSGALFYRAPDSLVRLVPEPPMGGVLGFQYFDPERSGNGELRFFHARGVGRALLYHLHDALSLTEERAGPHVLLTSGTSWAPGSWRYNLHVPPQAILRPNRLDRTAGTKCFFRPLTDPDNPTRCLFVSGYPHPQDRLRSLRAMVAELTRSRGTGSNRASHLEKELAVLDLPRQRILLVVGSYDEARAVGEALTEALGTPPGQDVAMLIPDSEGELRLERMPGSLLRSLLPQFAEGTARFLVAPLQAIERGHNILAGHQAAIGSVYFLVRPYPRPGDPQAAIQRINAWSLGYVPYLSTPDIAAAGRELRDKARARWDRELREGQTYRGMQDRSALLWTMLVLVWQCIGRLLRGGVPARVHFIDAKWAEVSGQLLPGEYDTEQTSMLLGFRRILQTALTDPDPAQRAIAESLYGPLAVALNHIEGVRYEP